ncbi:MAG: hypothetical protein GYB31_14220 [Bacteroidetes bacterium]|nr:hypothetical protein [Bacteroidota bacterium]
MGFINIFRTPKPQRYNYVPRYYNPEKEDLDKRLNRIENGKKDPVDGVKSRLEGGFMRRSGGYNPNASRMRSGSIFRSNIRLILVLGAILVLAYYFLSVYLPEIIEALE